MAEMMTEERSSYARVVLELLRLTQEGQIEWRPGCRDGSASADRGVENVFETDYKNRRLRLYRVQIWELDTPVGWAEGGYEYVLEMVDEAGHPLWRFPKIVALRDLHQAVGYRVARVGEFIKEVLRGS